MQVEEIRMSRKITIHLKVLVKNYGLFPDHINIHFLGLEALCVNYFNYQTQEKNIHVKQCHYKSIILKHIYLVIMTTVSSVLNQKILFGHSVLQRKPDFRGVNIVSIR